MVKVRVPHDIKAVGGPSVLEVKAANLGEVIVQLDRTIPGIRALLCDKAGEIYSNTYDFFVNGSSTHPSSIKTPVKDGDEVIVVPLEEYQHA